MAAQKLNMTFNSKHNWLALLKNVNVVGFDSEATGLDHWEPDYRVQGFSLAVRVPTGTVGEYIPVNHLRGRNATEDVWRPILETLQEKKVVIQNANYDRRNVKIFGYSFPNIYDTTKLSHLLDENWGTDFEGNTKKARNLENLSLEYLGRPGKEKSPLFKAMLNTVGWGGLSYDDISEYAEADAIAVLDLFYELIARIKRNGESENVLNYWKRYDAPNFDTLYNMKTRGIRVNTSAARLWEIKATVRMDELVEELGFDPAKPTQLKPVLYDELKLPVIYKKGKKNGEPTLTPTLDKSAMERYEIILAERPDTKDNPIAKRILEYRGWSKARSGYFIPYQRLVKSDGRLRPDYLSHGTITGRYSCKEPNLQQIPKESTKEWNGSVKKLFLPDDGYELWEFDYSQLEFRLSAHFSKEPKLLEVFNDDSRDIFNEMANDLNDTRQNCKTRTYSINYGAGATRLMDVFGYSKEEANKAIAEYYDNYPGLKGVNLWVKELVERNLKVKLWSGRYRHFRSPKDGYKAFNSFIQGGAADIVKHVMNRINIERPDLRMLLQVHDSIIFELNKKTVEEDKVYIQSVMEHPTADIGMDWRVHLKTDAHILGEG